MKRAALVLALLAGACAATPTPTRDELAEALRVSDGAPAVSSDITHIACQAIEQEPTGYACRWRQRDGRQWHGWQSHLARSGAGWQLIDRPERRP
ncbi:MAG TPA: hypothetical protein VI168_17605 [Croceibacterium sp.]